MLQDFYQIMEERTREMDPEMGYKVRHFIRPGLISMRPNPIVLLVLRKTVLDIYV